MQAATAQKLLELNRRFYADFGASFSATRQRIQPGVRRILAQLGGRERILDLGCGNGELARCLARDGFRGAYTGLDFSLPLLQDARVQQPGFPAVFIQTDLAAPGWETGLTPGGYDLVCAFAVLHHIPSLELRLGLLCGARRMLAARGKFILSNWQFLNSEKLRGRIRPWQAAGLADSLLDEGDYLLDWRGGGEGLRYAHHFSEPELADLAAQAGFRVLESFHSDGDGGRLGLYQVWEQNADHD